MTPTWPRLLGWMGAVEVETATGRWRTPDGEGVFTFRAPDAWTGRRMWGGEIQRGDYARPVGPVTSAVHDGRACWRVDLAPPPRKRGVLTLLVDDETGILLRSSNSEVGPLSEVLDLVVDPVLDAALAPEKPERDPLRELAHLCHVRPPPTPQWFPWRRSYAGAQDVRELEDGAVGRAFGGAPAPVGDHPHVVRLEHDGWAWAVSSRTPLDEPSVRRIVEQVRHERPRPAGA
ncbi:MAG: hypothetical protein H7233_14375 [Pseudorhodobacter sp.]|nr:hypothetical protein [Frankiaceae bacterium]